MQKTNIGHLTDR